MFLDVSYSQESVLVIFAVYLLLNEQVENVLLAWKLAGGKQDDDINIDMIQINWKSTRKDSDCYKLNKIDNAKEKKQLIVGWLDLEYI